MARAAVCEHLDRLTVEYMALHDDFDTQMAALEEAQRAVSASPTHYHLTHIPLPFLLFSRGSEYAPSVLYELG